MDGTQRQNMVIDVTKAHLVLECRKEVYLELQEKAGVESDDCGKIAHWFHGCRISGPRLKITIRTLVSCILLGHAHCDRLLFVNISHGQEHLTPLVQFLLALPGFLPTHLRSL